MRLRDKIALIFSIILILHLLFMNLRSVLETTNCSKMVYDNLKILGIKVVSIKSKQSFMDSTGKTTETYYYGFGEITSNYQYQYNSEGKIIKEMRYAGEDLALQSINLFKYDSVLNKIEEKEYRIHRHRNNEFKEDTVLSKKITYSYDNRGNNISTKYESYSDLYPESNSSYTREYIYDSLDRLIEKLNAKGNKEVYQYDNKGSLQYEIDVVTKDTIEYIRNDIMKTVEKVKKNNIIYYKDKYYYDHNGNKIESYLDNERGRTFKFKYDNDNRLIEEYLPGKFLLIFDKTISHTYGLCR
jgi:hypothetical protein